MKNLRCGWASVTDLSHSHAETVICQTWHDVSAFSQPDDWLVVRCVQSRGNTQSGRHQYGANRSSPGATARNFSFKRRSSSKAWSRRRPTARSVINCNLRAAIVVLDRDTQVHCTQIHPRFRFLMVCGNLIGFHSGQYRKTDSLPPTQSDNLPELLQLCIDVSRWTDMEWRRSDLLLHQQFFEPPFSTCDQTFLLLLIGKR